MTTLEEDFAAKQAALQKAQDDVKQNNQKVSSLQAEIAVLQSKIAEIKQAIAGYDQKTLQKQLDDARNLIAQKSGIAEAAIGAAKDQIDAKIKEFDGHLDEKKKKVDQAENEYNVAAKATEEADTKAVQEQNNYEAIKKKLSDIDAKFRDLNSLLDQANKAEGARDYFSVYFLAGEWKAVADGVQLEDLKEDLNKSIRSAQGDAETAKGEAAGKKVTSNKLWAIFSAAKKEYEAATISRRTDLLKNLRQ
jgi:predicted  nucleic acid-binding Zn-ribbon protein